MEFSLSNIAHVVSNKTLAQLLEITSIRGMLSSKYLSGFITRVNKFNSYFCNLLISTSRGFAAKLFSYVFSSHINMNISKPGICRGNEKK